jgi:hypothetical protein
MSTRLLVALTVTAVVVAVLGWSPWATGAPGLTEAAPRVQGYSSYELGPIRFTQTAVRVGTLSLPRGKYIVNAKATVAVVSGPADVVCEFAGGGAFDSAQAEQLRTDGEGLATLPLTASADFAEAGDLTVSCRLTIGGGSADATAISITAIKLTSLRATAVG